MKQIIDFHTHTFPDKIAAKTIGALSERSGLKPFSDGTLDGLINSMKDSGVTKSIILPVVTKPQQFSTINESSVKINEGYGEVVLSFGGIHPDSSDYKTELKMIKKMGLMGIKLHPDYQLIDIDDIRYERIIDYAGELGLITVVHAGIDVGYPSPVHASPHKSLNMIKSVHPDKLVLAHMGGCDQWDEVLELLAGEKVYFDTAFSFDRIGSEMFKKILDKHGDDRILFATDSPWCSQKESVEWINSLDISEDVREKILSGNAAKLLGL